MFKGPGFVCVFRALTISETESLMALSEHLNECAIEDWVVSTTLIVSNQPKKFILNKLGYGYVTWFAQKVMMHSNIKDEKEYLQVVNESRNKAKILQSNVEMLIVKAYPSLSYNEIKNMTQAKQIDLLANAEQITGVQLNLGEREKNNRKLRKFSEDAVVLGAEDITSPEAADKPDFNETF